MVRAAWQIAVNELRVQFRRRTLLVLGFVAPLVLAFVMDLVFGDLNDPDAPVTFDVAVVDHDGGQEAVSFIGLVQEIASSGLLDVITYGDEVAAREAIDDGDVGAAWVIPEGFTSAVRSAGESEILVIGDVDSPQTTSVVRAIAGRYATGIGTATLAGLIAVQTGVAGPDEVGAVAEGVASAPPLAELVDVAAESSLLDTTTNVMAGMALFFTFFIAGLPSVSLLEERSTGTLSRLLVAPVPSAAITAGKLLGAVLLGTLSMCALMAASSVLMGADWGPPLGALLVAAAAVIAAVGIMSVGGSLARSTEQAGNAQSIVAIVLAILGGAFVPIPGGDAGALGILKGLTPHGWWFDGVAALQHDGLSSALPAVAVLVTMGVATGALGLWLSRQVLRR